MKLLSLNKATEWLSAHLLPCSYKQVLGISCPMCGCQRGLLLLLQGDASASVVQFPPLVAWGVSVIVTLVLLSVNKLSRRSIQILLLANLFILLCNGIYQNCQ